MKGIGIAFFVCVAFSATLSNVCLIEAQDMEVFRNDYDERSGISFDGDNGNADSAEVDLMEFSERAPSAYPPRRRRVEGNYIRRFDPLAKPAPARISVEAYGHITIYVNGIRKIRVKNSRIARPIVIGRGENLVLKRGDIIGIRVMTKTKRKGVRVLIRIANKHRGSGKRGRKYFQFYTRSRHRWRASDMFEKGWASDKFMKCWPSAVETLKKVRKRRDIRAFKNAKFFWARRAQKTSTIFLRYEIGKRPCERWQEAMLDGDSYSCIPTWKLRARRRRRNQERIRGRGGGPSRRQSHRRTGRHMGNGHHGRNRRNSKWNHNIAGQGDSSSGRGTRRCDCAPSLSRTGICYRFERKGATRGKCRKDKCGAKYECLGRRRRSFRARTCYEKRITTTIVRTGKNRCDTAPLKTAKFIWVPYD